MALTLAVALPSLLALLPTPSAYAAPIVNASGPVRPGCLITVSGSGFTAFDNLESLKIFWDNPSEELIVYAGDITLRPDGNFSSVVPAGRPGTSAGPHTITVQTITDENAVAESQTGTVMVDASNWGCLPPNLGALPPSDVGTGFLGLEGAAAGVVGGQLVVANGHSQTDVSTTLVYDIGSNRWRPLTGSIAIPDAPTVRAEVVAAGDNGQLFVFGGRHINLLTQERTVLNTVEVYNPTTNTWAARANMPTARAGAGAALVDGVVYVVGGRTGGRPHSGAPLANNEAFDIYTGVWTIKTPMPVPMMDVGATVAHQGKVYVFGGYTGSQVSSLVQRYDPATDTWEILTPMPTRRSIGMAASCNGAIFVFGGVDDVRTNLSTIEVFDPSHAQSLKLSDGTLLGRWLTIPDDLTTVEDDSRLLQPYTDYTVGSEFGLSTVSDGTNVYFVGAGAFDKDRGFYQQYGCPSPAGLDLVALPADLATPTINPVDHGRPGTFLTATATGLRASERVTARLDRAGSATQVFSAQADGSGNLSNVGFAIPNAAAGQHAVVVVGTVSGLVTGRTTLNPDDSTRTTSSSLIITPFIQSLCRPPAVDPCLGSNFGVAGDPIEINGLDFGSDPGPGNRKVNLGTYVPLPDVNVVSWTDTKVVITVPSPLLSASLAVAPPGTVSNSVCLRASPVTGPCVYTDVLESRPGHVVNITGQGFDPGETVALRFESATGSPLTTSPATLTALVGGADAGEISGSFTVPLSAAPGPHGVVAIGGTSGLQDITLLNIIPAVTCVTSSGADGLIATMTGKNFGTNQGLSTVIFTATGASSGSTGTVTNWGNTQIVAQAPAGFSAGTVAVAVAGQRSNAIAFPPDTATGAPAVTCVSPNEGDPGTTITVTGRNFGADPGIGLRSTTTNRIALNGIQPVSEDDILSWSDTQIRITAPSGASNGNVTITAGGVASNAVGFDYFPAQGNAPSVSISPSVQQVTEVIRVRGSGFPVNQRLDLRLDAGTSAALTTTPATITVGVDGAFSADVTVPTGTTAGDHTILVGYNPATLDFPNGATHAFAITTATFNARTSPIFYGFGAEVLVDGLNGPTYVRAGAGNFTKHLYVGETGGRQVLGVDLTTNQRSILVDAPENSHPTGIAISTGGSFGGFLYAGMGTPPTSGDLSGAEVVRISTLGAITKFFTGVGGTAVAAGDLAFPPTGSSFSTQLYVSEPSLGRIVRVNSDMSGSVFVSNVGTPAYMAFGPPGTALAGYLFVSDSASGTVWKVDTAGTATVYATIEAGITGLAFAPEAEWGAATTLYVASGTTGKLYSVPLNVGADCSSSASATCLGTAATFATGLPEIAGISFVGRVGVLGKFDLFVLDDPTLLIKIDKKGTVTATLAANPSAGPAGERVGLSATGIDPSKSVSVTLNAGGPVLARAKPDFSGSFLVTFPIPSGTADNTYTLVAVDAANPGTTLATTTFTVQTNITGSLPTGAPSGTLSPTTARDGATVTVSGANLGASESLQVFLGGDTTAFTTSPASPTTDSSGAFSNVSFTVPAGTAEGTYVVTVQGGTSGRSVSLLLTVPAPVTVSLNPDSGPAGKSVLVTGDHFDSGSVTITLDTTDLPATTADNTGAVSTTITIPTTATPGAHTVTLTQGSIQASADYTVIAAVLSVNVNSGNPSAAIILSGTNFLPNQTVTFTLGGTSLTTTPGTVTADANGSFSNVQTTVPANATDGATTIVAAQGSFTASTGFTVIVPALSVSPISGPVGVEVDLAGTNFTANETITIHLDSAGNAPLTTDPALVTVQGNGTFAASITIPNDTSVAGHSLIANASGGTTASASFTVLASTITLDPASGPAGTQVTVLGSGYVPGANVMVMWDSPAANLVTVAAESSGKFATAFTVPATTTAAHTVTAGGGTAQFTVTSGAAASLNRLQGPAGTAITITGTGFVPNATVTPTFDGAALTTNPTPITTDGTGAFTATASIPINATAGNRTIKLEEGTTTVGLSFLVTQAVLSLNPQTGVQGSEVRVTGAGFTPNVAGDVTFNGAPVAAGVAVDGNGAFATDITVPNIAPGAYGLAFIQGNATASATFALSAAPVTATIRVTVTDDNTDLGLEGVQVWASQTAVGSNAPATQASGPTDANGQFDLIVPTGSYTVGAYAPNRLPIPEQAVAVTTAGGIVNVNFAAVATTVTISGKVTTGTPPANVADAFVTLYEIDSNGNVLAGTASGITNGTGDFTIAVPSGRRWKATAAIGTFGSTGHVLVNSGNVVNASPPAVNLTVATSVTLSGWVKTNGSGVAHASVTSQATSSNSQQGVSVSTGAGGTYQMTLPLPTSGTRQWPISVWIPTVGQLPAVTISVDTAGTIRCVGQDTTGVSNCASDNLNITSTGLTFTANVHTITATFDPAVTGAVLSVQSTSFPGNTISVGVGNTAFMSVLAPPSGAVTYTLTADVQGFGQQPAQSVTVPCSPVGTSECSASGDPTVSYDLSDTVTISGTIRDSVTTLGIAGAVVDLSGVSNGSFGASTTTTSTGGYTFTVPIDQTYRLRPAQTGYQTAAPTDITVTTLDVPDQDLTLTPNPATTISGSVLGITTGTPATVTAIATDNRTVSVEMGSNAHCAVGAATDYCMAVGNGDWTLRAYADGLETQTPVTVTVNNDNPADQDITLVTKSGYTPNPPTVQTVTNSTVVDNVNQVTLLIPQGAFGTEASVTITTRRTSQAPTTAAFTPLDGVAVDVTARQMDGTPITGLAAAITVLLDYSGTSACPDGTAAGVAGTLKLGYWNTAVQDWTLLSSTNNTAACTASAQTSHLTRFALLSTISTLNVTTSGSGTVTGPAGLDASGITCGSDCSESYASGTSVTLTATPAAGFSFSGWTGDADCSDGSVTVSANLSCTANFSVQSSGGGGGGGGGGGSTTTTTITPSGTISATTGGKVGFTGVTVTFPAGTVDASTGFTATVESVDLAGTIQSQLQATLSVAVPDGFMLGTRGFQLTARDGSGNLLLSFTKPVTMQVTVNAEDVRRAGGSLSRIIVQRYNPTARTWTDLPTRVEGANVVAADTLTPGVFGLLIELPVPSILGPVKDAVASDMSTDLRWTVPSGTVWYHIQVLPYNLDGPAINLLIGDPTLVASGSYQVAAPKLGIGNYVLLPGMGYVWRVRTSPSQGAVTVDDPVWSHWASSGFRTPTPFMSGLTLQAPGEGATVETRTPTLTWAHTDDRIFYYEVQVSQDRNFQTVPTLATAAVYWELVHGGLTTPLNSYAIRAQFPLDAGATYYWRVRPRIQGDGKPLDWSSVSSFKTP